MIALLLAPVHLVPVTGVLVIYCIEVSVSNSDVRIIATVGLSCRNPNIVKYM